MFHIPAKHGFMYLTSNSIDNFVLFYVIFCYLFLCHEYILCA